MENEYPGINIDNNGHEPSQNEELKRRLSYQQVEGAFREADQQNALHMLVDPGTELLKLLMRVDVPGKNSEDVVRCMALARHIAKCEKYHNETAKQEAMNLLAMWTSASGKRAKMLTDAIIGQRQYLGNDSNLGDKLKKWAFGDKATEVNK